RCGLNDDLLVAESAAPAYSLATSTLRRRTLPSLLLSWLRRAHPSLDADRTSSQGAVASPHGIRDRDHLILGGRLGVGRVSHRGEGARQAAGAAGDHRHPVC